MARDDVPEGARTARSQHGPALPLPDQVALVFQGGGALGSYQGGVYEALSEAGIGIDWVSGISIGAVNAALIAGNPPEGAVAALRSFWNRISSGLLGAMLPENDHIREFAHISAAATVLGLGVPGFFRPHLLPPMFAPDGTVEAISFYDPSPLIETLNELVDWDRVNHGPTRFTVSAVNIETGNFERFDNRDPKFRGRIDARHVLASGALPPGFPPVEIDGSWYWDGGLVSNTPLAGILEQQRNDILVFQVDLFPARGPRPANMPDVYSREKDVRFSSRTRQVTDYFLRERRGYAAMQKVLDKLPLALRDDPDVKAVTRLVETGSVNIVHLIYRSRTWEGGAKDFEFSRATMDDHWRQGREAVADVTCRGDILARNLFSGKSAVFDLDPAAPVTEKDVTP